jgi:uncharacterized pyridoxal phosphate-containing UPF0001 family protein
MQFQVARLQEIIGKIQFNCKLNFKNSIDVNILLDAKGLDVLDINKLIGAGVKYVGFNSLMELQEIAEHLLPAKKHYLGNLDDLNMAEVIDKFDLIESVNSIATARKLNDFCVRKGKVKKVLVQVNVLNNEKHFGFLPGEVFEAFKDFGKLGGIKPIGISSYLPNFGNKQKERQVLRKIRTVFDLLGNKYKGIDVLSLNAIANWEDVIAERVNEIRVGRSILEG